MCVKSPNWFGITAIELYANQWLKQINCWGNEFIGFVGYQAGRNRQPEDRKILPCPWWEPGHQSHRQFAIKAGGGPRDLPLVRNLQLTHRIHLASSRSWICSQQFGLASCCLSKWNAYHVTSGKKRDDQRIPNTWPIVTLCIASSEKICSPKWISQSEC